ncbi:thioredoxin [Paraglaciecola sp. MB-3u-78]|uniref:thioredoxin n=1 Tax=Paraglaciecola sp. MB-3u-78 TaxID=2058332 RepID=UPI000C3223A3|nr:thioredoxin [Paraglaciecola sp. MB-3u-78]PKG98476.1 thioredoxin [Paraglaciecola sp. MB-3u-78]
MEPIDVKDENFDELVLRSPHPVVVDFWAPWCGPCKMLGPMLKKIAVKYSNIFTLVMANQEDNPLTAVNLNVKSTPTLLIFKDGKLLDRRSGVMLESQITNWLDQHL